MKVLVAVPSKGRPEAILKDTLSWLAKSKYDWRVFVEPQDYVQYTRYTNNRLHRLKYDNRGLGYAKKEIQEYAEENNYEAIFKCDEDGIEAFTKYEDVKAISFPYSFQMFQANKIWTEINKRTQTCYLVRTAFLYPDPRISSLEDFATFIFIRVHNGIVLRYGYAGVVCRDVGSNSGGHQAFDREAQVKKEIGYLRELYPALKARKVKGKAWSIEPDLRNELFQGKKL